MLMNLAIKKGIIAGAAISAVMMTFVTFNLLNNSAGANVSVSGPSDCDSNAIIHCGALSTNEIKTRYAENKAGDVPQVYQNFGISSADVTGLSNKVDVGLVKADDTVWIGDKLIGVNAKSAGRNKTTHSTTIPGSKAYKRPPSDSFANPNTSIKIFVGYKSGVPSFAIISSCGNPLTWDKPALDIQKTASKDAVTYGEKASVSHGELVSFKIQIRETTGKAAVHGVKFTDALPAGTAYHPNSLRVNGSPADFVSGQPINVGTVPKGGTVTITFTVKATLVGKECGNTQIVNKASVSGMYVPSDSDTASIDVSKACMAKIECSKLAYDKPAQLKPNTVLSFKLTAGTVEHTTITGYVFIVNGNTMQETTSDSFAFKIPDYGTYNVEGRIKTAAGLSPSTAACKTSFKVDKPAPEPKFVSCEVLTGPVSLKTGEKGTYKVTTSDDSRVKSYAYKINGQTVTGNGNTLEYTSSSAGDYKITATITPIDGVRITNGKSTCETTVKVKVPVVTNCKSLSASKYDITLGDSTDFTATATAQGTTVKEYVFTVDGNEVQRSASNKFTYKPATAGNRAVKVSVVFANGDIKTSGDCEKTVKVKVPIITTCDKLTAGRYGLLTNESTVLTATATAQGTTVKEYVFTVDGNEVQRSASNKYEFGSTTPGVYKVAVTVVFANGDQKTSADCAKEIEVTQEIITVCKKITGPLTLKVGEKGTYTAIAMATGTTITDYTFTLDGEEVQSGASNEYAYTGALGTHTIKVTATFADGSTKTSTACALQVEVTEEPQPEPEPIYTCESLSLSSYAIKPNQKVEATVKVNAENGAEFTQARFNFGEGGNVVVVSADGNTAVADYAYTKAGERNITVELVFDVDGEQKILKNTDCKAEVTITEEPESEIEVCRDGKIIKIKASEKRAGDTKACVKGEVTELPNTGIDGGTMAGMVSMFAGAGTMAHRRRTIKTKRK